MMVRMAVPFMIVAAVGCSSSDATDPMAPRGGPAASAASISRSASADGDGEDSGRSGALHLIKNCEGTYMGQANDYCTITASNIDEIKLGSRVVYLKKAGPGSLDSDVIVYPPKSRSNLAFGHCALDFATGIGHCAFAGGTGKFSTFHASVTVSCVDAVCALDGRYRFTREDDDESRR